MIKLYDKDGYIASVSAGVWQVDGSYKEIDVLELLGVKSNPYHPYYDAYLVDDLYDVKYQLFHWEEFCEKYKDDVYEDREFTMDIDVAPLDTFPLKLTVEEARLIQSALCRLAKSIDSQAGAAAELLNNLYEREADVNPELVRWMEGV